MARDILTFVLKPAPEVPSRALASTVSFASTRLAAALVVRLAAIVRMPRLRQTIAAAI